MVRLWLREMRGTRGSSLIAPNLGKLRVKGGLPRGEGQEEKHHGLYSKVPAYWRAIPVRED